MNELYRAAKPETNLKALRIAETLLRLARVLNCSVEDLIEKVPT